MVRKTGDSTTYCREATASGGSEEISVAAITQSVWTHVACGLKSDSLQRFING